MSSIGQRGSQASQSPQTQHPPDCFSSCSGPRRTVLCGSLVPSLAFAVTPQTTPRTRPHRLHRSSRFSPSEPPPSLRRRRPRHRRRPACSSFPHPCWCGSPTGISPSYSLTLNPVRGPPRALVRSPGAAGADSHPLLGPASSSPADSCFQFPEPGAPDALQALARFPIPALHSPPPPDLSDPLSSWSQLHHFSEPPRPLPHVCSPRASLLRHRGS